MLYSTLYSNSPGQFSIGTGGQFSIGANGLHFISEKTGDRIIASSLKTAKSRIDQQATKKANELGVEFNHFTF